MNRNSAGRRENGHGAPPSGLPDLVFERRIVLSDGVDPDTVTATYDKGVLAVAVPIPEVSEPAPKSIPVKATG